MKARESVHAKGTVNAKDEESMCMTVGADAKLRERNQRSGENIVMSACKSVDAEAK